MADRSNTRILAIILAVVGIALIVWGYRISGSLGNEVARTFTGSSTDAVTYRYVGGAVCLAVGAFLFFRK